VNNNKKLSAFLAYLIPILGPLYVFIAQRDDAYATFHAKQSLALTALAIGTPLGWAVLSWALLWIPTAGPLIAVPGFTMVVLIYVFLAVVWIVGMANALRNQLKPLPIVGKWAERIPIG
jgi:uncharacterized membrane protein